MLHKGSKAWFFKPQGKVYHFFVTVCPVNVSRPEHDILSQRCVLHISATLITSPHAHILLFSFFFLSSSHKANLIHMCMFSWEHAVKLVQCCCVNVLGYNVSTKNAVT